MRCSRSQARCDERRDQEVVCSQPKASSLDAGTVKGSTGGGTDGS